MPDQIFLHVVWTTRNREPILTAEAAGFLERFLPAIGRQERAEVLAVGVVRSHVHVLARVHPTTQIRGFCSAGRAAALWPPPARA